jgi:GNAT superfamily N-acetyltransferase
MQNIHYIKGEPRHIGQVLDLIKELAVFEKAGDEVAITEEELHEDAFGNDAIVDFFVSERGSEVLGFAMYYTKYSTWKGKCIYLEDFLVKESERGNGIGQQLFKKVMQVAVEKNAGRMEWQVLDWNEPAINFYKKMHATLDGEWLNGKFTREQLQKLCS